MLRTTLISILKHGSGQNIRLLSSPALVNIYFIEGKTNDSIHAQGKVGKKVLDVALDHNIDIEGACGGELACSTCHVILSKSLYDSLPPKTEEEEDMLDLAWGRTDT
jgi:ferredoxin